MRIFKGKSDTWGIAVQYCNWDRSLTLQILNFYIIFVAHKYWKD